MQESEDKDFELKCRIKAAVVAVLREGGFGQTIQEVRAQVGEVIHVDCTIGLARGYVDYYVGKRMSQERRKSAETSAGAVVTSFQDLRQQVVSPKK